MKTRIELNPNAAHILEKIKANSGFCPCSLVKTEDTKCICKKFREQNERGALGQCDCGAFIITEGG
jgi:Ferredoxin thioredoxin reductase catalytic beta chain.